MSSAVRAPWFQRRAAAVMCLAAAAGLGAVTAGRQAPASAPAPPAVLITGARILDPIEGRYLPAAAVLIDGGRVRSITPDPPDKLPPGTRTIAADLATIVPGLVDAHAAAAPTPDLDASFFARLSLASGVTSSRALNVQTTWARSQRRRIEDGEILAPRLWVSGRGIDQGARPDLWLTDAHSAAAATSEVARQAAAGVDWIAGYDHLPPDIYRAIVAATKGTPIRVSGMPGSSSMAELGAAGVHAIETLMWPVAPRKAGADLSLSDRAWTETPARDLAALAVRLARTGVTLVPMLASHLPRAYPGNLAKDTNLSLLPGGRRQALLDRAKAVGAIEERRARRAWAARAAFVARFVRAGGRVVTGTGFDLAGYPVPGAGIHAEMAALVRAGLKPIDAIRAATSNAGALLGIEPTAAPDRIVGQVIAGAPADLFIVQGDPLVRIRDLSKITHVIRRGQVLN